MRRVYGILAVVLAVIALSGGGTGLAAPATPCAVATPSAGAQTYTGRDNGVTGQFILPRGSVIVSLTSRESNAAAAASTNGVWYVTLYDVTAGTASAFASGYYPMTGRNAGIITADHHTYYLAIEAAGAWTVMVQPVAKSA